MEPPKYNLRKRLGQPLHLVMGNVAAQPRPKRKRVAFQSEDPTVEVANHVPKQPANSKQRKKPPARNNTKKSESQGQDEGKKKRNYKRRKLAGDSNPVQNTEEQEVVNVEELEIEPPNLQVDEPMQVETVNQNGTNSLESVNDGQNANKRIGTENSQTSVSQKSQKSKETPSHSLNNTQEISTPRSGQQKPKKTPTKSYSLNNTQDISTPRSRQQRPKKTPSHSLNNTQEINTPRSRQQRPKKTPSHSLNNTQDISTPQSRQQFMEAVSAKLSLFQVGNQSRVKEETTENEAQSSGRRVMDKGGDDAVASGSNVQDQMNVSSRHDQARIRNANSVLLSGEELNVSIPLHLPDPAPEVDPSTFTDGNIKIVQRNGNQITINCKLCCKNYTTSALSMKKAVEKHMQKIHAAQTAEKAKERTNVCLNLSLEQTHNAVDEEEVAIIKVEDVHMSVNQTEFNHLLMNYVITKRLSTTVTEDPDFNFFLSALVKGTSITIPTPQQLLELLEARYNQSITKLQQQLKSINHICISADLFTKDCRTYLALMCHFIDPVTFQRHSKALVFRKYPQNRHYTNSQMYNEVREIILDKFGITQDRVMRFMANSVLSLSRKRGIERDLEGTVVLMNLACNNNFKCSTMKFADRQDATHQQCYAHKLERLAAHYVLHCLDSTDASLKLIQFWDALQNAPNIEATFVDTVFCSASLQCPQSKKYHLSHLSLQDVLDCVEAALKLRAPLNQAMENLNMSPFVAADFTFFEEMVLVMRPVLQSLLVMRRKENCYLGIILPTLRALQLNLKQLKKMSTKCEELRNSIMGGIERRFTNIIDVKSQASHPLVLATMSLPQWKQAWLRDISEENREFCKQLLIKEVARLDAEVEDCDPVLVSEEEVFFDVLMKKNEQRCSEQRNTETCRFIEDDRRRTEIIDQYPRVKRVFLKYNTILPTSAPMANFLCDAKNRLRTPFNCSFPDKYFEMLFVLRNEMETETN